jgi:hypothetical protein
MPLGIAMSELTTCNYCNLRSIRRHAKEQGLKVTVLNDARWGMGGCNVYVHPKSIKIREFRGGEDGARAKYRRAWFAELPERCCC